MNKPDAHTHLDTGTLTALVVGDLNARAKRKAQAHLLVCLHCAREFEEITQLWTTAKIPATTGDAEAVRQALLPQVAARSERKFLFSTFFTLPRISVGVVGALCIAVILWLAPGNPVHPVPAFADVERAMTQINNATWREVAYKGSTEDSPIRETVSYEVQRRPEPLIVRRATVIDGRKRHDFVQITNRWGQYTPDAESYMIWERGNLVASQIQEALYFPVVPSTQHQWDAGHEYQERWGWKWTRGAWKRETATLGERSLLRFTARDKQWRIAGRSHSPGQITIDKTVWVDPNTFRVIRSENRYRSGAKQWLTVRDNFRYNPSFAPVDAHLPPLGKTVHVYDADSSNPDTPNVPVAEVAEVKVLLSRVGAQWNSPNLKLSGLLNTEKHGTIMAFIPNPPKREGRLVAISEKPGRESHLKKFAVTQMVEVRYTPWSYRRDKRDQPFPPALRDTAYHVVAAVSGVSSEGKQLACPALFSLRRVNGTLRFTAAAFFPEKPAAAAQSWTQQALNKRLLNGAQ